MKFRIIDDRGRLFGRVNLIDFGLAVLAAVLAFAVIFPVIGIINKTTDRSAGLEKTTVLLTVKYRAIMRPIAMAVQEGSVQRAADGRAVVTLIKILESKKTDYRGVDRFRGRNTIQYMELLLQFKATAYRVKRTGNYYFSEQDAPRTEVGANRLQLGEKFTFTQPLYSISGIIVGIDPSDGKDSRE